MNSQQVHRLNEYGSFEGKPIQGQLIETHISWVILTDPYAFKIKKPMHYSFLDFSTLERRKYYCEQEVQLNRRLTDIYLGVLQIGKEEGNWHLGNERIVPVDYAVKMNRLDLTRKMDNLLRNDAVQADQISLLARKIARFHQEAAKISTPFPLSTAQELFNDLASVHPWVSSHLGPAYGALIQEAVQRSDAFLNTHESLLSDRIEAGFQRDGHGDLHSKNIFLYPDPIIFDCIEFNESFRQIDVLNEVAFFCMDLEAYGRWDLSEQFMQEYLTHFPCRSGLRESHLFTYYKCYRANVRAKVHALRAMQAEDGEQLEQYSKEVAKYLELMEGYIASVS